MAGGAKLEKPASPQSSPGTGMLWVATVVLSIVAALATWFAVSIVLWGSRYGELRGDGSSYLEFGAGAWVLGVVSGLLLTGAVLLLFHTVTGRAPSKPLMIGTAVVSLLLMQVALFITGEYGVRTADEAKQTCTTEEIELLEEINASVVAGVDATRPSADIDPVFEESTVSCVVGVPGTEAVLLDVLESDGWTLVEEVPGGGSVFERGDQIVLLTVGDGDQYRIEVPR